MTHPVKGVVSESCGFNCGLKEGSHTKNLMHIPKDTLEKLMKAFFCKTVTVLTSILTKWQRDSPMGVGISRKSMVGFEGLWTHNDFLNFFGPEVNFENDLKIRF